MSISNRKKAVCSSMWTSHSVNSNLFWNFSFDKGRLKSFVSWFLKTHGEYKTIQLLEELKDLGFGYATKAGISLGIDDLKIPPQKAELLYQAETKILKGSTNYRNGRITGIERLQQLIETWNQTSETLKQEVIRYFENTDPLNPVYMMAFSGARGNLSQVRQLVGMRGLMSDPQGQIIDFPIQSNFREGLTLTEYLISTYGARKGIVDTALRTATAGYLTRRLVDVAQHVIVSQFDCGTRRGIFLFDMKDGNKTIYSFQNRLIGRVLAESIYTKTPEISFSNNAFKNSINSKIVSRNQEVSSELAQKIAKMTKKALVRSPLTCETRQLVCQLCYGWSLSSTRLVSLGEAVGVIAAQSIGEPGTQLTMRTFHTGGVFSGGLTDQIVADYDGIVEYFEPVPGCCIRTPDGQIAFLTKMPVSFCLSKKNDPLETSTAIETFKIPAFSILFARHQQKVSKKQLLAQFSTVSQEQTEQGNAEQTVYSTLDGQIYFSQLNLIEQKQEKYEDLIRRTEDWAKIWILSGRLYYDPLNSYFFGKAGDFVKRTSILNQIEWQSLENSFLEKSSYQPISKKHFQSKKSFFYRPDSKSFKFNFTKQVLHENPLFKFSTKKRKWKNSFQSLLKTVSQNKNDQNLQKTRTPLKQDSQFKTLNMVSIPTSFSNYSNLKMVPPFYSPYSHLKRKTLFRKFLRVNFYSGTLKKLLEIHGKNKKIFKETSRSLSLKNSQDPFWLYRTIHYQKLDPKNSMRSNFLNIQSMNNWYFYTPMFLSNKAKNPIQFTDISQNSAQSSIKKSNLAISKTLTLAFNLPRVKQRKHSPNKKRTFSYLNQHDPGKVWKKKWSGKKGLSLDSKNLLNKKENLFDKTSFILKKPILSLDIEKIIYQNVGYNFSLNLENPMSYYPVKRKYYLKNYQDFKILSLTSADLNSRILTNSFQFYKKNKTENLDSEKTKWPSEQISSFVTLNVSKSLSSINYNQINLGQNFKSGTLNSTQQWHKDPTRFFYWLPLRNQTSTSGLFLMSKKWTLYPNFKKIKKQKPNQTYIESSKIHNQTVPRLAIHPQKRTNSNTVLNLKYWNTSELVKSDLSLTLPHHQMDNNIQKTETFFKTNFLQIKSTLNWNFIPSNYSLKSRNFQTMTSSKNVKFSVSNLSFFWIPQENYVLPNFQEFADFKSAKNFTTKKFPLFYLTNKQGIKKPVFSTLDGFISFYNVEKTKEKEKTSSKKRLKNSFKIGPFDPNSQELDSVKLKSLDYLKGSLKQKLFKNFQKKFLVQEKSQTQRTFSSKFQTTQKNRLAVLKNVAYFSFKYNSFNLLPIEISTQNPGVFSSFLTKETQNNIKQLSKKPSIPILRKTAMTVRPGWIYVTKFNSFHLHKKMTNSGSFLFKDICFEQNNLYTEIVVIKLKQETNFKQNEKLKNWNPTTWIQNSKNRFLSTSLNSCILPSLFQEKSSTEQIALLIRPMHYKSVENVQNFKKILDKSQQKDQDSALSLFQYKNYHASFLNVQKVNRRFLGSVPVPDFALDSSLRLPNKTQKKEKGKKGMFWNIRRSSSSTKQAPNSLKKYPTSKSEQHKSRGAKTLYLNHEKMFFSAFPMNFQPLVLKSQKNLQLNSGFVLPFLRFNKVNAFYFRSLNYSVPISLFFSFISNKLLFAKSIQNKTWTHKKTFHNQVQQKKEWNTHFLNIGSKLLESYEVLNDFKMFYDLPCLDFSMSQKYSNFTNQRIRAADFLNLPKSSVWSRPIRTASTGFESFNFSPVTKHDFLTGKQNRLFNHIAFAKTNFLSPYDGEIVSIFTKGQSKKKAPLSNGSSESEKWWESSNTLFTNPSQKNQMMHVFVTKKDLFSFALNFQEMTDVNSESVSFKNDTVSEKVSLPKKQKHLNQLYKKVLSKHRRFLSLEKSSEQSTQNYQVHSFSTKYKNKLYKVKNLTIGYRKFQSNLRLGKFLVSGASLYSDRLVNKPGQIIHFNSQKITLRHAQPLSVSPQGILHAYHDQYIFQNSPVVTLPFQTLKTGDIVQGIPKVEQYFEARTTQKGRLFISSLPVLLQGIFERYRAKLPLDQAVRQSFLKIQQMIVDGVQRVYRSQGVSIADKHLEIVVRQMTTKVQIIHGGQTGFFPGELVDLEFVERVNQFLTVKIRYQPVVLGITRASLEVDSFLSAASFQQTTKILAKASLSRKKDFLKGLKENLLVGNLIPSGTGYVIPSKEFSNF